MDPWSTPFYFRCQVGNISTVNFNQFLNLISLYSHISLKAYFLHSLWIIVYNSIYRKTSFNFTIATMSSIIPWHLKELWKKIPEQTQYGILIYLLSSSSTWQDDTTNIKTRHKIWLAVSTHLHWTLIASGKGLPFKEHIR